MNRIFKLIILGFLLASFLIVGVFVFFYFTQETETLNDEIRSKLEGKFIRLSKGMVHYELEGSKNGKMIVLIHGAGSGYYAWDKNFDVLVSKGFKVLRYDLFGRGFSDRPDLTYDPDLFENQLSELIDSLKIKTTYSLVSVSMGAIIAVNHVIRNPEKADKLIFIDPAALNDPKKPFTLPIPVLSDFLMTVYWYPRAIQKQMKEFYNPEKVKEYAELSSNQLKYKGLKRAMKSTWLHTLNQNVQHELYQIGNLGKKVLLLWGKNDPLIPSITSNQYKQAIPNLEFHEINMAGHLANYEQPDSVNTYIIKFLLAK